MHPPLMIPPSEPRPAERPHKRYKSQLVARVLGQEPRTLLEVGCGAGDLLAQLRDEGVAVTGVEPEQCARELAAGRGLDVQPARAEALPFADRAFDLVIFDYTAHHVERLGRALSEAVRVARRGVLVLDSWYDEDLPCQRVARAYDEWVKRIDRRLGFVHNPSIPAAELMRGLTAAARADVEYSYHLVHTLLPTSALEASARVRLADVGSPSELTDELDRILDGARRHGISDDGCVLLQALRVA